jgi:hypothetical protein
MKRGRNLKPEEEKEDEERREEGK